jgi:O-antigen ligase
LTADSSLQAEPVAAPRTWRGDAGWLITAGAVLLVPLLAVPNGLDPFRLPKELLLRAVGMLLLVVWAWRAFDPSTSTETLPRRHALLLGAIAVWAVLAALFASHKMHAGFALLWIMSGVLLFLTAFHAVQRRSVMAVAAVVLAAPLVNALLAIAESRLGWYPFLVENEFGRAIGLQGNANDLGALLAPALIFALAVAAAVRRYRWPALIAAVILALGIMASQTLTSMIAVGAGIVVMVIVHSARRGIAVVLAVAALMALFVFAYAPLRTRVGAMAERVRIGQFDEAMSNRLTPWLVAWRMSVANPVMGVGPGCFAWEYFPFKIETEQRYHKLLGLDRLQPGYSRYASVINFGEAHNEFMEVLAEGGWPALLILIASLLVIASNSKRSESSDERAAVARYLGAPFAVTAGLSFAGGFPLQLAASYVVLIFIAATAAAWARAR